MLAALLLSGVLVAGEMQVGAQAEQELSSEEDELVRKVSREVACEYCHLLTEDMWSMTVRDVSRSHLRAWEGAPWCPQQWRHEHQLHQ